MFIVGTVALSAFYVYTYERTQLEKCKKDEVGTILEVQEQSGGSWYMQYKFTVGRTEYIASETIKSKADIKYFYPGQKIDIYYSCTNPKVSRVKKVTD